MPTKTTKVTKTTKKTALKKPVGLTISVMGIDGTKTGTMNLPEALFAAKVNKQLLAQAVRVYLANQRAGGASTKTRGQVEGSTRKIYRQKGTGRARHGAIRAPIFVGGGIVFGPQPRDYSLKLPKKMGKVALASALTTQYQEGNVAVIDGLEKVEKTKGAAQAFNAMGITKRMLLIVPADDKSITRVSRNIGGVDVTPVHSLNTHDVLMHTKVVFTKKALLGLKA